MKKALLPFLFLTAVAQAADDVTVPNTFTAGTPAIATKINENFTTLAIGINTLNSEVSSLSGGAGTDTLSEINCLEDQIISQGASGWECSSRVKVQSDYINTNSETAYMVLGVQSTATNSAPHIAIGGKIQSSGFAVAGNCSNSDPNTSNICIGVAGYSDSGAYSHGIAGYSENTSAFSAVGSYGNGGNLYIGGTDYGSGFTGKFIVEGDGSVISADTFYSYSSEKYKTKIRKLDKNSIDVVKSIRAVSYNRKDNGKSDLGFIAEEVEKIIPEAVIKGKFREEEFTALAYEKLIPILLDAIKNQQNSIEELKTRISKLEEN